MTVAQTSRYAALLACAATSLVAAPPAHADTPTCDGLEATIVGTTAGETIYGTNKSDVIVALGADSIVYGGNGDDVICLPAGGAAYGENGADRLFAFGPAFLDGGNGADYIVGSDFADVLRGENGPDHLDGRGSIDTCDGGLGPNTAFDCEDVVAAANQGTRDVTAPTLHIVSPSFTFSNAESLLVEIAWQDAYTGIDVARAQILVDGLDLTHLFALDAEGAVALLPVDEGVLAIAASVADPWGNVGSAATSVVIDRTPPVVTGVTPNVGSLIGDNRPILAGFYSDDSSGVDAVEVLVFGSQDVSEFFFVTPVSAWAQPPTDGAIPDGPFFWQIAAKDRAGNISAPFAASFTVDTQAPVLELTGIRDGDILSGPPLAEIAGRAIEPHLSALTLDGTAIGTDAAGFFQAFVPLAEGENTFMLTATDALGHATALTLSVFYDPFVAAGITFFGVEDGAVYRSLDERPTQVTAAYRHPDGIDLAAVEIVLDLPPGFPASRDQVNALIEAQNPELFALGFRVPLRYLEYSANFTAFLFEQLGIDDPVLLAQTIQEFRDMFVFADHVLLPYQGAEGRFYYCVEAPSLSGDVTQDCVGWTVDVVPPSLALYPVSGQTLVAGPAARLRVRAYDPSRSNFLIGGSQVGPSIGSPLQPGAWRAYLNGAEVTHRFVQVGDETWEYVDPPLGAANDLTVVASDGVHSVTRVVAFGGDTIDGVLANVLTPESSLAEALDAMKTMIGLVPFQDAYAEITAVPEVFFTPAIEVLIDEEQFDIQQALVQAHERIPVSTATLANFRAMAIFGLGYIAQVTNDPRLKVQIEDWYANAPAREQLALVKVRRLQLPGEAWNLVLKSFDTAHPFVQYFASGFPSIYAVLDALGIDPISLNPVTETEETPLLVTSSLAAPAVYDSGPSAYAPSPLAIRRMVDDAVEDMGREPEPDPPYQDPLAGMVKAAQRTGELFPESNGGGL